MNKNLEQTSKENNTLQSQTDAKTQNFTYHQTCLAYLKHKGSS